MMNRKILAVLIIFILSPAAIALSSVSHELASTSQQADSSTFIRVQNGQFMLDESLYYFVGVNFWQGMNLGVDGPTGDRNRLIEELDHLQEIGVTNLRVMASSEGPDTEPFRMIPPLMISPGVYNEAVFDGLDFLLAEIGKRDMYAVMVLGNYWQWSGGFAQYVSWVEDTPIPYPGDWNAFMNFSADFYDCEQCQEWYHAHIETVINRENPYTGLTYRDDPAIFAWELANEPRRYPDEWIDDTAAFIKSLDPNHMVTTGSEGTPPYERQNFIDTHDGPDIDYATIHIWPENWGWYNPENPDSYEDAEQNARDYFQENVADAETLNKPLVLEEFGLARDWEPLHDKFDPASPTIYRDRFYTAMFEEVYDSASSGGPVAGDMIWSWSSQALPGDNWIGDPPHETPGWYSVYATDESTITIIAEHAAEMAAIQE